MHRPKSTVVATESEMDEREVRRYGLMAIALHWLIALLIVLNWPLGYFGEAIEQQLGRSLVPLHKSLGLTVLALSLLRLGWRLSHRPPPLPASLTRWRLWSARIAHFAMYVLIIALPLSGWMRISSGKYPLTWFGLVELPKFPIEPNSREAAIAATSHELLAWSMMALVAIHIAAALHHQFRLRNEVLSRMIPIPRRRGSVAPRSLRSAE